MTVWQKFIVIAQFFSHLHRIAKMCNYKNKISDDTYDRNTCFSLLIYDFQKYFINVHAKKHAAAKPTHVSRPNRIPNPGMKFVIV